MNINNLIKNASPEQTRLALQSLLHGLVELGFDADDPINGGDAVEAIAALFEDVTKRVLNPAGATVRA